MLIQITNTYHMGCPHCMDRASPEPQHMTEALFSRALELSHNFGVQVLLISGGEPTCHPDWARFMKTAAEQFGLVVIPTNGAWLGTPQEDQMLDLIRSHANVSVQISSFRGLYRDFKQISKLVPTFCERLRRAGVEGRLAFETDRAVVDSKMLALGRAQDDPQLMRLAAGTNGTTSCFSSALTSAQAPLNVAIGLMELRGKFCHPLVDWQGALHWSESWLCPAFAHVTEDDATIARKAHTWRPCGRCADYAKLLAKTTPQYQLGKAILGIPTRKD